LIGVSADADNYQRHNIIVKKLKELRLIKQAIPDHTKMPGDFISKLDKLCTEYMQEQIGRMKAELSEHI